MDDTFRRLYCEFETEAQVAVSRFIGDRAGYRTWYKTHLYNLCREYSENEFNNLEWYKGMRCKWHCNGRDYPVRGVDFGVGMVMIEDDLWVPYNAIEIITGADLSPYGKENP